MRADILLARRYLGGGEDAARDGLVETWLNRLEAEAPPLVLSGEYPKGDLQFDLQKEIQAGETVWMCAVTLGHAYDRLAALTEGLASAVLDACANAVLFSAFEKAERKMQAKLAAEGRALSRVRFPGDGLDFADLEKAILRMQTEKYLGVSVNSSYVLVPAKTLLGCAEMNHDPCGTSSSPCSACKKAGRCHYRRDHDLTGNHTKK